MDDPLLRTLLVLSKLVHIDQSDHKMPDAGIKRFLHLDNNPSSNILEKQDGSALRTTVNVGEERQ